MSENVTIHHKNLNPDECKIAVDDYIQEQCKDFVNPLNTRFEMKIYTNGIMMVVKQ